MFPVSITYEKRVEKVAQIEVLVGPSAQADGFEELKVRISGRMIIAQGFITGNAIGWQAKSAARTTECLKAQPPGLRPGTW